jgi:hypothetical protein
VLEETPGVRPQTIAEVLALDREARERARAVLGRQGVPAAHQ